MMFFACDLRLVTETSGIQKLQRRLYYNFVHAYSPMEGHAEWSGPKGDGVGKPPTF